MISPGLDQVYREYLSTHAELAGVACAPSEYLPARPLMWGLERKRVEPLLTWSIVTTQTP